MGTEFSNPYNISQKPISQYLWLQGLLLSLSYYKPIINIPLRIPHGETISSTFFKIESSLAQIWPLIGKSVPGAGFKPGRRSKPVRMSIHLCLQLQTTLD